MPSKRKSNNSQTTSHAKSKRSRPEELFNDDDRLEAPETQPRRSSRDRKGCGGLIQQLRNIEDIQSARPSRQSTRDLDLATVGEGVNAMAPSHLSDTAYEDEESQLPPWTETSIPSTQVRPAFTLSQASQFGFRIPPNRDGNEHRAAPSIERPSSVASATSSYSTPPPSLFSTSKSRTGSEFTAASSQVSSRCGPNGDRGMAYGDINASQLQRRSSQLRLLATAATEPRKVDEVLGSPPPRPAGFHQTPLPEARINASDIDEQSPDEDERLAESIVCNALEDRSASTMNTGIHVDNGLANGSVAITQGGDLEDVVAQHHRRNRPPRLPDNAQLMAVRNQQMLQRVGYTQLALRDTDQGSRPISRNWSRAGDIEEAEAHVLAHSQAPPAALPVPADPNFLPTLGSATASTHADNTDPSQLSFYPPPVRDFIERAKQLSHCDLASLNSFPLRPQFNSKAVEYIDEAIVERRNRGLTIPDGKYTWWWPQYLDGITKLLWEDIGNWRSSLKKKARNIVRERYRWDSQNRRTVNAELAKALLERGDFLKNGKDEEGHTNNLAHPALEGLVVDFFYTGCNSVGSLFPEVFANEVPRPAVALAATAVVKLALDEVAVEGKEVTFKRDVYTDVYTDILGLMTKCDTTPVHRAKTKALRVQWAKIGMNGGSVTTTTGFEVDLD